MNALDIFNELKPKEQKFALDIMNALKTGLVEVEDFDLTNKPVEEKMKDEKKEIFTIHLKTEFALPYKKPEPEKVISTVEVCEPVKSKEVEAVENKITPEQQEDIDLFNTDEPSSAERDCQEIEQLYKKLLENKPITYHGIRLFFVQTVGITPEQFKCLPKNKMELGNKMQSLMKAFKKTKDLDKIAVYLGMSKSTFPKEKTFPRLAFIKILKDEGVDTESFNF